MQSKRILLIRTDRIGDVVLSTPAIKAVRDTYPDAYVAVMVRPYASDIVDGNLYLNEVIIYDKDGIHRSFIRTLLFSLRLRKKKFDIAFILNPSNRAHIITFLAGIPKRIGLDRKMSFLLTKRIKDKKFLGEKHELDYTLDILRTAGIRPKERNVYMPVRESAENSVNIKLAREGCRNGEPLVAVHAGASCPSKRWPAERFAELIGRLREKYGFQIVVVAGHNESEEQSLLKRNLKTDVIDLSGKTTVAELAALFKRCRLFISNDSGPVHIASAVGTPCVVIFGRNKAGLGPKRWGPLGRKDVFLHKNAGCKICLAHNCENGFKCLKMITVDDVFESVEKVIKKATLSD